jgi:hypothetical protein
MYKRLRMRGSALSASAASAILTAASSRFIRYITYCVTTYHDEISSAYVVLWTVSS